MVLDKRKITYRIYPSKKQNQKMLGVLRGHQQLYNAALEERISAYKKCGISLSYYDQCKSLTQVRQEIPEQKALNSASQQVTLNRLHLAFQNFFTRVKQNKAKAGFPRFKSFDRYPGWGYKVHGSGWFLEVGEKHGILKLGEIGYIKIRGKARNIGTPKTMEILHKQNKWYASVTVECIPKRKGGTKAIGIDWGLETYATIANHDDTYRKIANPRFLRKKLKELKQKQKKLSKKKLRSTNRKKARIKVAALHAKVANQRKDFLHQTTAGLVKESALIAIEKLSTKNMSSNGGAYKKGLNREILSAAPGAFHQMLKCKAEEAGIELIEIPTRQVKPSQTCSSCGHQEKKLLSVRKHDCACGAKLGRDENAARVILNWAFFDNATGRESAICGEDALATSVKQETPSIESVD